jgi:tetratricopeptide (TPR) repeat protein
MIRSDYFMRMVQDLMQTLQRVAFLKDRQQYEQALDEIDRTLARFWDLSPDQVGILSLDDWITLCIAEGGSVSEKLIALGDLFLAQGELRSLRGQNETGQRSYLMALGLYIETLRGSLVSMDLIEKANRLIDLTRETNRPPEVLRRLLFYYEARGMFAQAEDVLFQWIENGDAQAKQAGTEFYERLLGKSDEELERGDLPRAEVEQGRDELLARAG